MEKTFSQLWRENIATRKERKAENLRVEIKEDVESYIRIEDVKDEHGTFIAITVHDVVVSVLADTNADYCYDPEGIRLEKSPADFLHQLEELRKCEINRQMREKGARA